MEPATYTLPLSQVISSKELLKLLSQCRKLTVSGKPSWRPLAYRDFPVRVVYREMNGTSFKLGCVGQNQFGVVDMEFFYPADKDISFTFPADGNVIHAHLKARLDSLNSKCTVGVDLAGPETKLNEEAPPIKAIDKTGVTDVTLWPERLDPKLEFPMPRDFLFNLTHPPLNPTPMSNQLIRLETEANRPEPDKTYFTAGITDSDGNLTENGGEWFLNRLFRAAAKCDSDHHIAAKLIAAAKEKEDN